MQSKSPLLRTRAKRINLKRPTSSIHSGLCYPLSSDEDRIVGVLHDVVEDTSWTFDQLREEGFSEEMLLAALDTVTKRENEDYPDFISRSAGNAIGRRVKIADLRDNMDPSRIPEPTEKDLRRIEKYKQAMTQLEAD